MTETDATTSASIADATGATEADTRFVITGFGPFGGVEENPTTVIVRRLDSYLRGSSSSETTTGATRSSSDNSSSGEENKKNSAILATVADGSVVPVADLVDEYVVLETSAGDVDDVLDRIRRDHVEGAAAATVRCRIVLLHLGVGRSEGFRLELCAYNDATFRIPDQRGFQPHAEPIVADPGHVVGRCYETSLDLDDLRERMEREVPGVETSISTDPGRFVCNYVYCKSLEVARLYSGTHRTQPTASTLSEEPPEEPPIGGTVVLEPTAGTTGNKESSFKTGGDRTGKEKDTNICCESLFLHVPHFSFVAEDDQVAYVATLIKNLAEQGTRY